MEQLLLRTLGPLVLQRADGEPLSSTRRKELALLAYLARREGRPVRRAELLELLWGDRPEEKGRLSLRQALLRLRRMVGDVLEVTPDTATLRAGVVALDLALLERDIAAGRHAEAVARCEGEFLAAAEDAGGESYRVWMHAERAAIHRLVVVALEHLIGAAAARGDWDAVITHAERWLAAAPSDSRAHVALMDALLVRGRAAEALARHAAFVSGLDAAAPREVVRLGERLEAAALAAAPPPSPGSAGLFSPDLVGRASAHAELVTAWRTAREGHATTVVLEGEAGIGKTRLVDEFLRGLRAERRPNVVLRARAHVAGAAPLATARDALAPLERAPGLAGASPAELASLTVLLPSLHSRFADLPAATGAPDPAAIAGVLAAVAAEVPVILVLDDAATGDAASRALLFAVARRLREAAVLVVVTARPGDVQADDLRDADARTIRLGPLDLDALDALLASMLQMDDAARRALAARLLADRGGNPFDVVETVRLLVDDGLLAPDASGAWRLSSTLEGRPLPVPATVRQATSRRVARLSEEARRTLAAAASLGPSFTVAQAARATGIAAPLIADAVDQLVSRRFVRAASAPGEFEIAHPTAHLAALELRAHRARSPGRFARLAASAAAVVAAVTFAVTRQHAAMAQGETPRVAVAAAWETSGDSANAWLADGVPRLIESKLARFSDVEVVPSIRVDALRDRVELRRNRATDSATALDLGRRLDATWVVRAAVSGGDTAVALDLTVHDVGTGRLLRRVVFRGPDVFATADAAVAQILALAGVGRTGPRLAELETSSTLAFEQYIRAARASAEGRGTAEIAALDAAIALDSAFGSALLLRAGIAREHGDTALLRRLSARLARHRARLSERDRLHWDASSAMHRGDHARAERLATTLIARFPRDPRGVDMLADLYFITGRWREMRALLLETLAMDSLGIAAGRGPCVPCVTYGRLVELEWLLRDPAGAEQAARRWVEVQPASANAHHHLAKVLARRGRGGEAERSMRRAVSLAGNDPSQQVALARLFVMTRRWAQADSLLREWTFAADPDHDAAAVDIASLVALERGELRDGIRAIEAALAADPRRRWLELILGTYQARVGDIAGAAATFERHGHLVPGPVRLPMDFGAARNFAWSHALLADAIAPGGDTVRLKALADSIELVARYSIFSRDWKLHHHVRGLVAMRGRRWAEAERAFEQARWGESGWTRTLAELAKAQLAQGRAADAVRTLRSARDWPDAMGRYQAGRETDSLLAVAFDALGRRDSAAVYRAHVRQARRRAAAGRGR